MGAAVRTFRAMADPARCLVVEHLAEAPRSAGELAALAGLSKSAMSRHLRVLLESGLVADDRSPDDARVRMFRIRPEGFDDTTDWWRNVRAHWERTLESYAEHVEHVEHVEHRQRDGH
jgi:DNA-binding transcriptional ArsR family regulator